MRIYLAGPDVFRPDAQAWFDELRRYCQSIGVVALIPLDGVASTAISIFENNVALIRQCDAIVANLNAFRGVEPDSGTCFELGLGFALGKCLYGYVDALTAVVDQVGKVQNAPLRLEGGRLLDQAGWVIEDFGLPLNLMLSVPLTLIAGDVRACLQACIGARR